MRYAKGLKYSLILSLGFLFGCDQNGNPALNGAAALRWNGAVDLDVDFNEFFGGNHTLACWFMMQYPYGPGGPMLAENGTGTFFLGQGDYYWGNGGFKKSGDPVIHLQIGNTSQSYVVSSVEPGEWAHLALVRSGNTFTAYLNGTALSPSISYSGAAPTGNLRIGRRTDGMNMAGASYPGQFYGFVDEVAVFDRALSVNEINALASMGLNGSEQGLVAGFPFNFGTDANAALPATLQRSFTEVGKAYRAVVSDARDSAFDEGLLPMPEMVKALTLPFAPGTSWRVVQSMHARGGSHNGYAAFCYDFARNGVGDSTGQPLYAVADARIDHVVEWQQCSGSVPNRVQLNLAPGEFISYEHIAEDSYTVAQNIDPNQVLFLPQALPDGSKPTVNLGEHICNCGSTGMGTCNNAHLHIAAANTVDGYANFVTTPFAFTNYEASDDNGASWYAVDYGIPQPGQYVRLP